MANSVALNTFETDISPNLRQTVKLCLALRMGEIEREICRLRVIVHARYNLPKNDEKGA